MRALPPPEAHRAPASRGATILGLGVRNSWRGWGGPSWNPPSPGPWALSTGGGSGPRSQAGAQRAQGGSQAQNQGPEYS
eukprot:8754020-Alexandrium_andersonii.AAC.1